MIDQRICACDEKCWTRANKGGDRGGGWACGENGLEGFLRWVGSSVTGGDCVDALIVGGAGMGVGDAVMEELLVWVVSEVEGEEVLVWVVKEMVKEIAVGF